MTQEAIAAIGHNRSPFEIVQETIHDLYEEAKLWLDGEPVTTQDQADALNTLKSKIKEAAADAEVKRVAEIKPHKDKVDAIQAQYNTLIGNNKTVVGLAIKAEQAVNAALKPYLVELDRLQQEKARLAREAADKLQREAMEAMRQRDAANLESIEDAEKIAADAKAAAVAATKAEGAKAHAKGEGRATGLRTVPRAVMTDKREAAAWVWKERNAELMEWVQDQADKAVRAGARTLQGFEVKEEKVL